MASVVWQAFGGGVTLSAPGASNTTSSAAAAAAAAAKFTVRHSNTSGLISGAAGEVSLAASGTVGSAGGSALWLSAPAGDAKLSGDTVTAAAAASAAVSGGVAVVGPAGCCWPRPQMHTEPSSVES